MQRELPEIVQRLLRTPDSQETLAFVSRNNVSRRNWDIFCRAMGGGGREKMKQCCARVQGRAMPYAERLQGCECKGGVECEKTTRNKALSDIWEHL